MSNPPDPNEYLRLLLQLQQQQQAGAAPRAQAPAPSLQPQNNAIGPANAGALASLRNMLAGLSNNAPSLTLPNALPAFLPTALPNPSAAVGHASENNAENDVVQQQQLLLASASLLVNVNPQLASAAMEHAMSLATQNNTSSQNPEPGNITHHVQNYHHNATKKSSPTSSNSSGNSNPSSSIKSSRENSDASTTKKEVTVCLPNEPVNILTLQTWSLGKLEAYAQQLKDNKEAIPDAVKILLDDARQRNEKLHAKRMSNRKFASESRARTNQLIAELSASNRKLRRGALVLSYIPDPVIALDLNGKIKFCSVQMERVLQHRLDDLIGASIEHICVPKSRGTIRRLIRDLVTAEQLAAGGEGLDRGNDSGDSSNDTNFLSRRSDQSFPLLEVNVDDAHAIGSGENVSDSSSGGVPSKDGKQTKRHKDGSDKSNSRSTMSSLTQKSSSFFSEASAMKNNKEPLAKKSKPNENGSASTSNSKASGGIGMNVDDVMGSSVTANNAEAKLSSLIHYPKEEQEQGSDDNMKPPPERMRQEVQPHIHEKHRGAGAVLAQKQDSRSSSSNESQREQRDGQNSSEDSGYRESNESSDSALDSSSMSGISSRAKGSRYRPLAPCCNVRLVRADLTTLWCELTLSIRTRDLNDEDSELGIFDLNPKPTTGSESSEPREEKELLLCCRPFFIGEKVGEELRFPPHQISESSNANDGSGDITSSNKSSSGNDNKSSSGNGSSGHDNKSSSGNGYSGHDNKSSSGHGSTEHDNEKRASDSDAPSRETQVNSENSSENQPSKKHAIETIGTETEFNNEPPSKKLCIEQKTDEQQ